MNYPLLSFLKPSDITNCRYLNSDPEDPEKLQVAKMISSTNLYEELFFAVISIWKFTLTLFQFKAGGSLILTGVKYVLLPCLFTNTDFIDIHTLMN